MTSSCFLQHGSEELPIAGTSRFDYLDFSVNTNPWGPPESVSQVMERTGKFVGQYPDIEAKELKEELARFHSIKSSQIAVGNGSSELIYLAARLKSRGKAFLFIPTFSEYERALKAAACKIKFKRGLSPNGDCPLNRTVGVDIVFLDNPNNPTGALIPSADLLKWIQSWTKTLFVMDEVFMDFSDDRQSLLLDAIQHKNLIVIRSLTKLFAIPGLRVGYAVAHEKTIGALTKLQPPWSVNTLAQEVGKQCLREKEFIEDSRRKIQQAHDSFFKQLSEFPWLKPYPSQANFILCEILDKNLTSGELQRRLLEQKILVRNCDNFRGLKKGRFIRVAVRKPEENEILITALREKISSSLRGAEKRSNAETAAAELAPSSQRFGRGSDSPPCLAGRQGRIPRFGILTRRQCRSADIFSRTKRDSTKFLMIQGTGSGVGKSVITTALCRFFKQEGFRVAPFKAQNMSNNSYVTRDGGEIGRAQAVQAMACGIEPTVHINPILLKPTTDIGAQVIVHGRPIGMIPPPDLSHHLVCPPKADTKLSVLRTENQVVGLSAEGGYNSAVGPSGRKSGGGMMDAREYQEYQSKLIPYIEQSLQQLKNQYDLVIIEGAGSPAEVNLYDHDIVNMKIAQMTDAAVILVGDIELGGVFASLVGTLELLQPEDRNRIRGFLINKFRGDRAILEPGLRYLQEKTARPVIGVLPYDSELHIEEEDGIFWARDRDASTMFTPTQSVGVRSRQGNGSLIPTLRVGMQKILIHVVEFPRISNHTDFDPLIAEPDVELRYIREVPLDVPDLLILPGTRSTMADLEFLHRQGLFSFIQENVKKGMRLLGICGGYQMLGEELIDMDHVESSRDQMSGFGFFPSLTRFNSKKMTAQVRAIHLESGIEISGYEIHMGITENEPQDRRLFKIIERGGLPDSAGDGTVSENGIVWGTYIHGLFESGQLRRFFLNQIRLQKGWPPLKQQTSSWDRSTQFDRLAEMVRQHVKMESIYEWLGFTDTFSDRRLPIGSSVGGS